MHELEYVVSDSGARHACATARRRELVARLAPPGSRIVSAEREAARLAESVSLPVTAFDASSLPTLSGASDALQLYTSGTTGRPKGAVLTHANLAVQACLLRDAWGWTEDDVLLHALPLHHMHGLAIALLACLGAGASVDLLPSFDAQTVWNRMAHATVFMAVPTMYAKLLSAFDEADEATRNRWTSFAKGLRLSTSGSAALPVSLAHRWRELTGEIPLERFGMTEVGVALSNPLAGERRAGTVGTPLPTVATRIVDDEGRDASSGELWLAGPSVFRGYHERASENATCFVERDGVRWFRTGDTVALDKIATLAENVDQDERSYFRILGRTSVDILKSGGYKLSALEIEEACREHETVADVAVVGLPDPTWGERVVACVVPRPHAGTDGPWPPGRPSPEKSAEALRAFLKTKLAPYKVPKLVLFMEELPRNALGKVVKPELVRKLADGLPQQAPAGSGGSPVNAAPR
jgi:malonyl-CoA/methylmalonyl-CoA synthetase